MGYVTLLIDMQNLKINTDNDKNEEPSYFKYCDGNTLYGWAMLQKLPDKWIWLCWRYCWI